jgi:hypothetical protein
MFQQILVSREHGDNLAVDVLHLAESILLITPYGDRAVGAGNLEDVEAVVRCRHELDQGWVAKDGVVGQHDVGNVEVEGFCPVVVPNAEGDGNANLPDRRG